MVVYNKINRQLPGLFLLYALITLFKYLKGFHLEEGRERFQLVADDMT